MSENVEILELWREGMEVSKLVYELTATSLPPEIFGMSSPLRRTAEAIPANLAKAAECTDEREAIELVRRALEAAYEADTLLAVGAKSDEELPADVAALQEKLADVAERIARYVAPEEGGSG